MTLGALCDALHRRGFQSNEKTLTLDLASTLIVLDFLDQPHAPLRRMKQGTAQGMRSHCPYTMISSQSVFTPRRRSQRKQMLSEVSDQLNWLSGKMQIKYKTDTWVQLILSFVATKEQPLTLHMSSIKLD